MGILFNLNLKTTRTNGINDQGKHES